MRTHILDVFRAHRGTIALAGAGGKKSTIFRLVSVHPGRVAVTSTVHTPRFRKRLNITEVVSDEVHLQADVARAAESSHRIGYAHPSGKPARLSGVSPKAIRVIHEQLGFDATFVKADGARLRWLKAPNYNRPVLPEGTTVLISILSVRAIGKPLTDELAHHAREVANILGVELGEIVTASHLARLLASDHAVLEDLDEIDLIPVLNMVENKEDLRLARLTAEQALDLSSRFRKVVLASMIRDDPVVEVMGSDV
jgi:probable selenium-dependent hydroxylase accessory protein YqeC